MDLDRQRHETLRREVRANSQRGADDQIAQDVLPHLTAIQATIDRVRLMQGECERELLELAEAIKASIAKRDGTR